MAGVKSLCALRGETRSPSPSGTDKMRPMIEPHLNFQLVDEVALTLWPAAGWLFVSVSADAVDASREVYIMKGIKLTTMNTFYFVLLAYFGTATCIVVRKVLSLRQLPLALYGCSCSTSSVPPDSVRSPIVYDFLLDPSDLSHRSHCFRNIYL